jgi:hypothetical protein
LYSLDLRDVKHPLLTLFKSSETLRNIVKTSDEKLSIICNEENRVIIVDNKSKLVMTATPLLFDQADSEIIISQDQYI